MSRDLSNMRVEYTYSGLHEEEVEAHPVDQFERWFEDAVKAELDLPNAMILATADADGRPAARYVLLKGYDHDGFVFYSHTDSHKGEQLQANPRAALVFYWHPMHRQVRIEGGVEILEPALADDYFRTRPRGSQLSAWVARQSSTVPHRSDLLSRMLELEQEYDGQAVPRPPNWLGYRVVPERLEFWQGQENRLHDRLLYSRAGGGWRITRLAP
jgi:pyridoxamine 5'-phosphate oxidase